MKYENDEYLIDKKGCFKKVNGKDEKLVKLASPIFIVARYKDPIHKKEQIIIQDQDGDEYILDSSILSSRNLFKLIEMGFSINENHIKELSNALQDARNSTVKSSFYKGVGVMSTNKGTVIVLNDLHFSPSMTEEDMSQIICDNKYDLMPNGNLNDWLSMFKEQVNGNVVLELVATFGVSALVTRYLFFLNEIEFTGIIYSLTGQSSSGKTTAAMLAASIAGNPTKGSNTLFRSWNGTRNALEGYLSSNYGLPIVLDELSAATFKDTTGLLYSLAEGQGRQRSNIDGNVKALKNWGTSVISTAEHSVLNNSARNDGLNVRTIEISEAFTTSADNADAIKRATSVNYGHIMPLVAEYLLKREDEVIKWFHAEHDWFKNQLKNETSHTGIRMFKRYAVIATSARIFERVIAVPIDIDAVREYLVSYHLDSVSERSLAEKAIEVIVQFVAQNRGKFSEDTKLSTMIENYGLIELKEDHIQVKILKNVFKNMLNENQFQDVNIVIDALRDKGYIHSDRNRKTTKRSVPDSNGNKKTIVFYHLKLDMTYASMFGLSSKTEPSIPPPFVDNTNKNLLNDFVNQAREKEASDDLEL
ncbi:cassette chromosome replicative helicase [Staphylococcus saprophyticus]|uniref:cassette chromosome replicative helicase n=1 Tax=Staphylococcus saprophyticus TaxID=29385 RepID=UPI0034DD8ECA